MKALHWRFIAHESGATAIEYALMATILGVGLVTGFANFSTMVDSMFDQIVAAFPSG